MRLRFVHMYIWLGLLAWAGCQSNGQGGETAAADSTAVPIAVPGVHPNHGQASVWESVIAVEFVAGSNAEGHQLRVTYPDYNSFNLMAEDLPVLLTLNQDGQSFRLATKSTAKVDGEVLLAYPGTAPEPARFEVSLSTNPPDCPNVPATDGATPRATASNWGDGMRHNWTINACPRMLIRWDAAGLRVSAGDCHAQCP